MDFSDFARLLYPFCACEYRKRGEYTAVFIDRIMEEGTSDQCPVLDATPGFLRSVLSGREDLPKESASIMLAHLDKERFAAFVEESLTADTMGTISKKLKKAGYENDGTLGSIGSICADIYEEILINITGGDISPSNQATTKRSEAEDAIIKLREMLDAQKPPEETPPDVVLADEQVYINALYAAYGSACQIDDFTEMHLNMEEYAEYREDLSDRRIDYFAAESIKHGLQEVYGGQFTDQFDVLKQETYDGIKNTVRRRFPDGYEKMLAVMEQAVRIPVEKYLLAHTHYWIGNSIMCGVCHHLVNEHRIKWV